MTAELQPYTNHLKMALEDIEGQLYLHQCSLTSGTDISLAKCMELRHIMNTYLGIDKDTRCRLNKLFSHLKKSIEHTRNFGYYTIARPKMRLKSVRDPLGKNYVVLKKSSACKSCLLHVTSIPWGTLGPKLGMALPISHQTNSYM